MVAGTRAPSTGTGQGRDGGTTGVVGFYKSTDAGEHWTAVDVPEGPLAAPTPHVDARPLRRIGGGDLPTLAVDPKNDDVVYSASTVMWRTDDGGVDWTAVRGSSGGDDYQKIWINPHNPDTILVVSDQGAVVSANGGKSWSNWYTQPTAAMYHVTTDDAFPYRVCGGQQDSGSACVDSRSNGRQITFHDWHPVNIQEYGIAAPDPKNPDMVYGSSRNDVSLYNRKTGQTTRVGPNMGPRGGGVQPRRPDDADPLVAGRPEHPLLHVERRLGDARPRPQLEADQPRPVAADLAGAGDGGEVCGGREARPRGDDYGPVGVAAGRRNALGGHRRRQHPDDDRRRRALDERDAAADQAVDPHLQHRRRPLRHAAPRTPRRTPCASTT